MRTKVINNTITRLLNFEKYSNFKQALEDTAIVNDFQVVLLSEDFNPLIIVETRHQITIDEAIRVGRDLASGVGDSYRFVEIGGTKTYWGAININSEKYYLLLVDNEDKYSNEEINMLAEIIELSMGMWKYTPERDAKAEFIRALIRGNKSLAYSLREEAGVSGENILSVFFIRDFDQQKVEEAYQEAEEKGDIRMIKVVEDSGSYGLILKQTPSQEKNDVNYIEECIALFDRIKDNGFKYSTVAGMTISLNDIKVSPNKHKYVEEGKVRADRLLRLYHRGLLTEPEWERSLMTLWDGIKTTTVNELMAALPKKNPINMMAVSGARGNKYVV